MAREPAPPGAPGPPDSSATAASGAVGTAVAFLPHVLHHAGLIAGAAFLTGLAGGVAFAALGLLASRRSPCASTAGRARGAHRQSPSQRLA